MFLQTITMVFYLLSTGFDSFFLQIILIDFLINMMLRILLVQPYILLGSAIILT